MKKLLSTVVLSLLTLWPALGKTVYFENSDGWETVAVHYWNCSSVSATTWGEVTKTNKMYKVKGLTNIYVGHIPDDESVNFLFYNGKKTGTVQSVDITSDVLDNQLWKLGSKDNNNKFNISKEPFNYIFYDNTDSSWASVSVWADTSSGTSCNTNTNWPGDEMTHVEGTNFWYWKVPTGKSTPAKVIFTNNDTDNIAQTSSYGFSFAGGARYTYDGKASIGVPTENDSDCYNLTGTDPGTDPETPTDPDLTDPTLQYVLFTNNNNWDTPYVWAWSSTESNCTAAEKWPGEAMTQLANGLWFWQVPDGKSTPENIIFSNKGSDQVGEFAYTRGGTYSTTGLQSTDPGTDPGTEPDSDFEYVWFENDDNWEQPYAWAWKDSEKYCDNATWPGDAMTLQNGKWYWVMPADKSGKPAQILFNNGKSGQEEKKSNEFNYVKGGVYSMTQQNGTADAPTIVSAELDRTGAGLSNTLPILYINVTDAEGNYDDAIIDKDLRDKDYRAGTYWLDLKDCTWMEGATSLGSAEEPLDLEIKARGNHTRTGFSKKPFKLKLGKKQNMLGLSPASSKHYALLAHADDDMGFMRNYTGFSLGKRIGLPWTPSMQPVEVVINGNYRGLYFLTESVRVETGRVDIASLKDEETSQALISGGYMVELDNYPEVSDDNNWTEPQIKETQIWLKDYSDYNKGLYINFDTPELLSQVQKEFLMYEFNIMNNLIGKNSNNNDIWKYLDLDDAARYYVIMEICSHYESYHGSTYLYRDRGEGQKWHFSPLWDMGHAFDGGDYNFFYYCPQSYGNSWIKGLRQNVKFNNKVLETWRWFINNCYTDFITDLETYANRISQAAVADHNRWNNQPLPVKYENANVFGPNNPQPVVDNSNMTDKLNTVKSRLNAKINWLKGPWGSDNLDEPERDDTPAAELPDWAAEPKVPTCDDASHTLPIVYVTTTDNAAINYGDENLATGRISITDPDGENFIIMDAAFEGIKGCGLLADWNDSAKPKKEYKVKFAKKTEVLDMPTSKHWVLMPYYPANGGNNIVTDYLGSLMSEAVNMPWSPRMTPVELVVNGDYSGLYFLAENVRIDDSRIADVTDYDKKAYVAGKDWVIEFNDNAVEADRHHSWTECGNTHHVISHSPDLNSATLEEDFNKNYSGPKTKTELQEKLAESVTTLRNAAYSAAGISTQDADNLVWNEVIDASQAARFMVVQEVMDCHDAYNKNLYAYHGQGTKWMFGPVWNFRNTNLSADKKSSIMLDSNSFTGVIFQDLWNNLEFKGNVKKVFTQAYAGNLDVVEEATEPEVEETPQGAPRRAIASGSNRFAQALEQFAALGEVLEPVGATTTAIQADAAKFSRTPESVKEQIATLSTKVGENIDFLKDENTGLFDYFYTAIETITDEPDASANAPIYFDLTGRRVANPSQGIYIVRRGNKVGKVLVK